MAAEPGTGSPEAIAAAVKLLDAGLGALLDGRQVSALTQAKVALAGFTSVEQLALIEDTRIDFRVWVKDVLALDAAVDPSCKLEVTTLVGCYEAAKARFEKRLVTDAEASSARLPKVVPRLEHLELRAKFEKLEYKLEDALTPSKALLESVFESIEEGELRNLALKDLVSVEEADDFDELLAGFDSSGTLRLKKGTKEVPVPVNSEGLRRRLKLLGHLYMMCKIRYPTKAWLSDMTSRLFDAHADFLCGEHVMGLQAKNEHGTVVATPGLALCLSYDYQLRKEMAKQINAGLSIKVALNKAVENTTLRERFFTTPCALQVRTGASSAGSGNPWDAGTAQSRSRPLTVVSGKGNQVSPKKQKKGKGKGVKGGKNWNAPDGREVCFAFNGEGCSNRNCSRLHVCRRCFGDHTQANCPVPAASAASSPASASASASAAAAPKGAKGAKGAGG